MNLNLAIGDPSKDPLQGGLETNFSFQSATEGAFKLSPWLGISTPGVLWKVKVNTKVWPFSFSDFIESIRGSTGGVLTCDHEKATGAHRHC